MRDRNSSNSISRMLRCAAVAEVLFLVLSGFFVFTEHRAHYLGALPYALLIVSVTVFFWIVSEGRKQRAMPEGKNDKQQQSAEPRQI